MGKLIYLAIASLDGYVADENGDFDWSVPDAQVHAFVNDLERGVSTYLYGRRLYEVMIAWERMPTPGDDSPAMLDFARLWRSADKIVYSRSLRTVSSARTRIERVFDPDAVRRTTAAADGDTSIGGPELAGQAIEAGLVDEFHLLISPVMVGGGKRALPDGVLVALELLGERRFDNGVVHLHYRRLRH